MRRAEDEARQGGKRRGLREEQDGLRCCLVVGDSPRQMRPKVETIQTRFGLTTVTLRMLTPSSLARLQAGMQVMQIGGGFGQPQPIRMSGQGQHSPAGFNGQLGYDYGGQRGWPQPSPRMAAAQPPAHALPPAQTNADFMAGSEKAVRLEYDPVKERWVRYATVLRLDRRPFAEGYVFVCVRVRVRVRVCLCIHFTHPVHAQGASKP